jgi:hypothetical protein
MLTEMRYVNAFIEEESDSTLMRQGFANPNKIFSFYQILADRDEVSISTCEFQD